MTDKQWKNKETSYAAAQRKSELLAAIEDEPKSAFKSQTEYANEAFIEGLRMLGRTEEQITEFLAEEAELRARRFKALGEVEAERQRDEARAKALAEKPTRDLEALLQ